MQRPLEHIAKNMLLHPLLGPRLGLRLTFFVRQSTHKHVDAPGVRVDHSLSHAGVLGPRPHTAWGDGGGDCSADGSDCDDGDGSGDDVFMTLRWREMQLQNNICSNFTQFHK